MEKVQAGLRRSQLKMQICGVRVFWSQGPKEEARPEGRSVGLRLGKGAGVLQRAPKKVKEKKLPTGGSPNPESLLLVKTARGPQGVEKGGGEVRWPVLAGAALPAPGSASIPSSCGETARSQRGECWIRKGGRAESQ